MAKRKKRTWQKGKSPKELKAKAKLLKEQEDANKPVEKTAEEKAFDIKVLSMKNLLDSDKPINELHKLLFFDDPLGRSYIEKMMNTPYEAYHKVLRPETLAIEELISIAGFLQVNALWLFCRIYGEYNQVMAKKATSKELAANRFKRAFFFQELSRSFRETRGHHLDERNGTDVISKLLPSHHVGEAEDL